jgi:hypothetical protein
VKYHHMRIMVIVFSVLSLILTACTPEILLSAVSGRTNDMVCEGTLNDITIDNLVVPEGSECILNGTHVEGDLLVEANASLIAYGVIVDHNLQGEKAALIEIHPNSVIGGNIIINESGLMIIDSTIISGNVEISKNLDQQAIINSQLGGNLHIFDNSAIVTAQGNTINGDLLCDRNDPMPSISENFVSGERSGQCEFSADEDPINQTETMEVPYYEGEYQCSGSLDAVIVDDLIVPMNASCTLNQTQVKGSIKVYENASLEAFAVTVEDDIEAEYAVLVKIQADSYVGGDVEFSEGDSLLVSSAMIMGDLEAEENFGEIIIMDSTIKGDVELEENRGNIHIENNTIEDDLEIEDNMGGVTLINNVIYGDLECEENYPTPTGHGNEVHGEFKGQCSNLQNAIGYESTPIDNDHSDMENGQMTYVGDDYQCTGSLGMVTADNLEVPMNAACTLNGTKVEGNIKVYQGATLIAYGVSVSGNLQAQYADKVEVRQGSYIGGNIQFEDGGILSVVSVFVGGNLESDYNWGSQTFTGNTIEGDIQVESNSGGVSIRNNTIYGDLECEDNYPAPTGSGNIVYGDYEGQCMW